MFGGMEDATEHQAGTSVPSSQQEVFPLKSIGDNILESPVPGSQMLPGIYPAYLPNFMMGEYQEHPNRGAGLYAVPVLPYTGSVAGPLRNTLIPLTYTVPTRRASSSEGIATGQENQPVGQQAAQQQQQQQGLQGPVVVRRFEIAIHLDVPLLLKLLAVIYLFHQDGSRQRYQTGALAPLTRWLTRAMHRAPQPARPPRDALPPDDVNPGNENAAGGQPEVVNENQPAGDGNPPVENNQHAEEGVIQRNANPLWGLVKEIQIIVLGFITSLLPGFQHLE